MSIKVRVNEYDHIEIELKGDIWELSIEVADKLSQDLHDAVSVFISQRRLQELLDNGGYFR